MCSSPARQAGWIEQFEMSRKQLLSLLSTTITIIQPPSLNITTRMIDIWINEAGTYTIIIINKIELIYRKNLSPFHLLNLQCDKLLYDIEVFLEKC